MAELSPNPGKKLVIHTDYGDYERYPVKTKVVVSGDDLKSVLDTYLKQYLQDGDMVYMSEKIVAISQGRAFDIDTIKPSRLANFLVKFVYKSPYGIGLGSPWTMELAIREVGGFKIVLAAIVSGVAKLFGKRGVFYDILGSRVAAIDGPCDYTLPPYNHYAKMAPKDPMKVSADLSAYLGHTVIVIDANDLDVKVLGKPSADLKDAQLTAIFKDNPLGQASEQTPLAVVRKIG
ncbi:MAG: coenzyme F420-0:L-glutamate ligase [Propionibacteriaceae bacterium]|nr:coenzyme F420-0:L-glutamate ligase [Propionibacteriaceae bacterium]